MDRRLARKNIRSGLIAGALCLVMFAITFVAAAVYVVGARNGVWGVYHSDDGGATWARFNDDAHQYGGIGVMAADWSTYGRIYFSGTGRGIVYTN